jgi:integrase
MRALRWHDVDLASQIEADPSIPPNMALVRSVRAGGDTKTRKSRRALALRRDFRRVVDAAGLVGREWAPRELRHSFVSLLSDAKVPIESISRLVGHRSTMVTETIYRKQLRPVIEGGAEVMDRILPGWPHAER